MFFKSRRTISTFSPLIHFSIHFSLVFLPSFYWSWFYKGHCGIGRRLLRVPWTARRSHQSILKKISPGCSLEGLMLKLKLQYFGHLMRRADSLEKTLMLGKIEGRRKRGWQMMRWLDGITDSTYTVWVNSGSWWWTGRPGVLRFMGWQRVGHNWATELKWTWKIEIFSTHKDLSSAKYITELKSTPQRC